VIKLAISIQHRLEASSVAIVMVREGGKSVKYWIYDDKKFRKVDESRLDFSYRYNPPRRARFMVRKPDKWIYVPNGLTIRECWYEATRYERERLEKCKAELQSIIDAMEQRYGKEPEEV
jgi:hypothetical protein